MLVRGQRRGLHVAGPKWSGASRRGRPARHLTQRAALGPLSLGLDMGRLAATQAIIKTGPGQGRGGRGIGPGAQRAGQAVGGAAPRRLAGSAGVATGDICAPRFGQHPAHRAHTRRQFRLRHHRQMPETEQQHMATRQPGGQAAAPVTMTRAVHGRRARRKGGRKTTTAGKAKKTRSCRDAWLRPAPEIRADGGSRGSRAALLRPGPRHQDGGMWEGDAANSASAIGATRLSGLGGKDTEQVSGLKAIRRGSAQGPQGRAGGSRACAMDWPLSTDGTSACQGSSAWAAGRTATGAAGVGANGVVDQPHCGHWAWS